MNVVVVGECGTGKSSLVNLIIGRDVATTSNSAAACTTDVRAYETSVDGCNVKVWDTPGFNEGHPTRAAANTRSLETVVQSLHQLVTKGKIHLLIYCMSGNRAKAALLKHYDAIRAFLPYRVPMVAVVTRLERYQNRMDDWWSTNERELTSLGMNFADHACITTIPDSHGLCSLFRERRLHSKKAVRDLILRNGPSRFPPVVFPRTSTLNSAVPEQKDPRHKGSEDVVPRSINMLTTSRRLQAPMRPQRIPTSLFA